MKNDFNTVRAKIGGLKGVMRALGDAPDHDHKWKNLSKCPFCGGKDCSGIWEKKGAEFFKCHKSTCSSGNIVMTEVGYIAAREGLSETKPASGGASPAYERFLKLAGCWEEATASRPPAEPSVPPEPETLPVAPAPELEPAVNLELVAAAVQLMREKKAVSVAMLREHLKIGAAKAQAVLAELERLGMVGPARERAPRDILNLPAQAGVPAAGGGRDGLAPVPEQIPLSEKEVIIAIEVVRWLEKAMTRSASAAGIQKFLRIEPARAALIMAELERRGMVGPSPSSSPDSGREILNLPAAPAGTVVVNVEGEFHVDIPAAALVTALAKPEAIKPPAPKPKEEEEVIAPGLKALRWYFDLLPPTEYQMAPYMEDGTVPEALTDAVIKNLKFRPVPLLTKRGLTSATCAALSFRANPRTNESLLHQALELFGWDEVRASGLWLKADPRRHLERRPNTQFCGKGQLGKKPEKDRRDDKDKWVWGWSEPVLIPYFDALGKLIKLRPHKGGAPAETAAGSEHIYVPRPGLKAGDTVEKFEEVVICEGEYKAAAIWQTIGAGMEEPDAPPMGVCSLPGISFAKNVGMRDELEEWLREVGARTVYVAFDDEDTSRRPLRQRHDAQIYARFLAMDLARKLHLETLVVTLPKEWRNAKGKADWDGALADILGEETSNTEHSE